MPSMPATGKADRRRPITLQAQTAGCELTRAVERLERILADDRFPANSEEVTNLLRPHILKGIDKLTGLSFGLPQLPYPGR